jgi:protein ImuB
LVRAVSRAARRLGFAARAAAAPAFACAWAVARFGAHDLAGVAPGACREALAGLPVAALRPEPGVVDALAEIGVTTIGHVLDLPRAALPARFGAEMLLRIDQALGRAAESIEPVRLISPPRAEVRFEGPTDRWESVEAAAREALDRLAAELARRECGVRRLTLELVRPYAGCERIEVTLSRPSRNIKHLWSLLRPRLERVDLGCGVEGVVLTASRTTRLRHEQTGHDALGAGGGGGGGGGGEVTARAWGELVDTLVGRLGAEHVVRVEPVESHLPERAFRERSVMEEASPPGGARAGVTAADRPTRLYRRPEPADAVALTPDGPLLYLGWRGRRWRVTSCVGPERIGPAWWRWNVAEETCRARLTPVRSSPPPPPPPPDRDYFAAQLETGRWLWVCRQVGTGRWFVHGEWS